MKQPIIKIENLEKRYPTPEGKDAVILKDVDLAINEKDFAIIFGPSGSGKSTLMHHIVGLELPTEGKIIIRGTDITKMNQEERAVFRAENFGMVYQFWYWSKSLLVWENVAMPLFISSVKESQAKKKAMKVLEEVGMEKYANKHPMQLSGGEQQRIGIARALVNDPLIVMADEPTGNLDTHNADQVMGLFGELNVKNNRTIVMVTHNLAYLPYSNKNIAMKDGKVVSSDTETVKAQIRHELKGVL